MPSANSKEKRVARHYQFCFPGTTYPEALRIIREAHKNGTPYPDPKDKRVQ